MRRLAALIMLLSLLGTLGWSKDVRIATYNVENLFDLNYDHREYVEYIPNTSWQWNLTNFNKKLANLSQVVRDLNADIIALQEIESDVALKALQKQLKRDGIYYPYRAIANAKNTTVKVALLSQYPIVYSKEIWVTSSRRYRNILEVKVEIDSHPLYLFVNHWKAKSGAESKRMVSSKALKRRLNKLGDDKPLLLLGDFNSHYEEYLTFKKKRRHNDTRGVTGINHILKTYSDSKPVSKDTLLTCKSCLYNLWYDTEAEKRWSHTFKGERETLDNIIISKALLDGTIHYKNGSISNLDISYLIKKEKPYRWQQSRHYPKHHTGKGFSDHLPVFADFSVK